MLLERRYEWRLQHHVGGTALTVALSPACAKPLSLPDTEILADPMLFNSKAVILESFSSVGAELRQVRLLSRKVLGNKVFAIGSSRGRDAPYSQPFTAGVQHIGHRRAGVRILGDSASLLPQYHIHHHRELGHLCDGGGIAGPDPAPSEETYHLMSLPVHRLQHPLLLSRLVVLDHPHNCRVTYNVNSGVHYVSSEGYQPPVNIESPPSYTEAVLDDNSCPPWFSLPPPPYSSDVEISSQTELPPYRSRTGSATSTGSTGNTLDTPSGSWDSGSPSEAQESASSPSDSQLNTVLEV
ncbi:unnamed protein product [Ranitomeya imitator]|uniref:Uncharacterized protein n=1 Tax=Ranitomeya imitator TaxID=111125 RepID=A0ABN9L382_9NEOB|nr:unnamed protein product [Ranitomeya imitator]